MVKFNSAALLEFLYGKAKPYDSKNEVNHKKTFNDFEEKVTGPFFQAIKGHVHLKDDAWLTLSH